ncbi:MAG: methyl-accepting chemotaxis protein, partial [bacterium]|nr:methyl-accepting chemotaxis protein [bacterium]
MSLKKRFAIFILVPTILIFTLILSYSAYFSYQKAIGDANSIMEAEARENSNYIKAVLEVALDTARTMANMFGGMVVSKKSDRIIADMMLKKVLEENKEFFGVWVCFEPNAFDGKDLRYAGKEGHDATGRFIPYWYRDEDRIHRVPLENYDKEGLGDYYLLPLKTGKETILEPYEYTVSGKNLLFTSLAVPIKADSKVIGVAGVDFVLNQLADMIKDFRLYKTGFGIIISNKGTIVAHKNRDLLGRKIEELEKEKSQEILNSARVGKTFSFRAYSTDTRVRVLKSFVPINIGNTETRWIFGVEVPEGEVIEDVKNRLFRTISISILGIGIIAVILIFLLNKLISPIKLIMREVELLGKLDLRFGNERDLTLKRAIEEKGEIGDLAKNLRFMIDNFRVLIVKVKETCNRTSVTGNQISDAVNQTTMAVQQVATTVQELANGSQETAKNVQEVSSAVDNIGNMIEALAQNASAVEKINQETAKMTKEGQVVVDELNKGF